MNKPAVSGSPALAVVQSIGMIGGASKLANTSSGKQTALVIIAKKRSGFHVSSSIALPDSLKSLFQGGLRFDASEEYLEFRFLVLNAAMITGVLFTAVFIALDWFGVNSLGWGQLLATAINCVLTAALVFVLRGRKQLYGLVSALFVVVNYATFLSALLLVVNDELRVIWFFVEVVFIYILLGLRAGVAMTVATMASILAINPFIAIPFSRNAMTTLLIGLGVTSALSYVYTKRAQSFFQRMRQGMAELQELAEKDALTGLLNPRAYYDVTNRLIWLAHRTSSPYALLFVDLDHFKMINDCFGHETGDAVLTAVARTLSDHIRQSDVLGRIGGEEFSILLPDTTPEGAMLLAEKLRAAVAVIDHSSVGTELLKTTASIGIAFKQPSDQTIADIQRRADRTMYQAKFAGRNRVVVESS